MGRVIDADALIELARKTFSRADGFVKLINEQPTAYDIEKVVAELEENLLVVEMEDEHIIPESDVEEYFEFNVVPMDKAIEIVRKGGAE